MKIIDLVQHFKYDYRIEIFLYSVPLFKGNILTLYRQNRLLNEKILKYAVINNILKIYINFN